MNDLDMILFWERVESGCCFTCKYFSTDMTDGTGKPMHIIGECRHPSRGWRVEMDDSCPDHEPANWTKNDKH